MKTFTINEAIKIDAEYYETRYSWGHKAYLYINGHEVEHDKIVYQNRTWESYQFQSILYSIVRKTKALTKEQKEIANEKIKNQFREDSTKETKSMFSTVAMVSQMGEFFGTNQEEKNDWKARMLKAGLENKGLIMPEDWDSLSESVKEERLNKVIGVLKQYE